MRKISKCYFCNRFYVPVHWFNPMDVCVVCQTEMLLQMEHQMKLITYINKPRLRLLPPKDDNEKAK